MGAVGPKTLIRPVMEVVGWIGELFSCGHRKPCGECGKQRVRHCGRAAWLACEDGGIMLAIMATAAVITITGLVVIGV